MKYRQYDHKRDEKAVQRIWREVGWLEKGEEEAVNVKVKSGRAIIAEIDNEAECCVTAAPGSIRYLNEELPFSGITSLATSLIARKQGLAKQLTAMMVAIEASEGALVSGVGVFDQGYYDQFGFGTGSYEHFIAFHPSQLNIRIRPRLPRRINTDDWAMVHSARLVRFRSHGSCNLNPAKITKAAMLLTKNGFGLGYGDNFTNELTHHFWCRAENVEQGPYTIEWITFQTREQFLELMALIGNLGDQVHLVKMHEPPGIQLQDLLKKPLKQYRVTEKSKFQSIMQAAAYWQVRVCNLLECMTQTHLQGDEVRFNLRLIDPIDPLLEKEAPWHGLTGNYVVTLGPSSGIETGIDKTLPTLVATVGAFTRMWLGVRPATGLTITDQLSAPRELLEKLDWILRLPEPKLDWQNFSGTFE